MTKKTDKLIHSAEIWDQGQYETHMVDNTTLGQYFKEQCSILGSFPKEWDPKYIHTHIMLYKSSKKTNPEYDVVEAASENNNPSPFAFSILQDISKNQDVSKNDRKIALFIGLNPGGGDDPYSDKKIRKNLIDDTLWHNFFASKKKDKRPPVFWYNTLPSLEKTRQNEWKSIYKFAGDNNLTIKAIVQADIFTFRSKQSYGLSDLTIRPENIDHIMYWMDKADFIVPCTGDIDLEKLDPLSLVLYDELRKKLNSYKNKIIYFGPKGSKKDGFPKHPAANQKLSLKKYGEYDEKKDQSVLPKSKRSKKSTKLWNYADELLKYIKSDNQSSSDLKISLAESLIEYLRLDAKFKYLN